MPDTFDQLCDEAREAKGDLLNAIRCAVNELMQDQQRLFAASYTARSNSDFSD